MNKLVKAHFRKCKSGLIVVVLFVILSVSLMTVGLSILFKADSFYTEKLQELNGPDAILYTYFPKIGAEEMHAKYLEKLQTIECITEVQSNDYLEFFKNFNLTIDSDGDEMYFNSARMVDLENNEKFPLHLSDEIEGKGVPIYLSSYQKIKNKMKLGSPLKLTYNNEVFEGYVAGFYEHMVYLYSSSCMYTTPEWYDILKQKILDTPVDPNAPLQPNDLITGYNISVKYSEFNTTNVNALINRMNEIAETVKNEYIAEHNVPPILADKLAVTVYYNDLNNTIPFTEPYILLLSVIMVAFSIIITIIALIILRFLIKSGIEDDIKNIGILKGLGYTTKELRLSYLYLNLILLGVGALVGVIIGISLIPAFSLMVTILANLSMKVPLNLFAPLIGLVITVGFCLITVYVASGRLSKITPIHAIRDTGNTGAGQKKNHFRLDKSKVGLNSTMSLKSIFNSKRQSMMIFIVSIIVAFVCAFASVCYYNMNINRETLLNLSGRELYDVGLFFDETIPSEIVKEIKDKVLSSDLIEDSFAVPYQDNSFFAQLNGDYNADIFCSLDYPKLRTKSIYDGRYPVNTNELALSGIIAKNLNLKIGDAVTVKVNNVEEVCTIVGLAQSIYANNSIFIYKDFLQKSIPEMADLSVLDRDVAIYLKDPNKIKEFMSFVEGFFSEVEEEYDWGYYNNREWVEEAVFSMIAPATTILMTVVLTVTSLIVASIIFMIIRIKLIRERKSIAINKALGFTTFSITNQMSFSILFVTVPGIILGGILGGLLTPPLIGALGKYIGLMKLDFTTNYLLIGIISVIVLGVTYAISALTAMSTRFITPRILVGK